MSFSFFFYFWHIFGIGPVLAQEVEDESFWKKEAEKTFRVLKTKDIKKITELIDSKNIYIGNTCSDNFYKFKIVSFEFQKALDEIAKLDFDSEKVEVIKAEFEKNSFIINEKECQFGLMLKKKKDRIVLLGIFIYFFFN